MPPKDDDEPKTTKEVVTKKHKQMLNREELDLSLIAEALGGVISEAEVRGQQSFPGMGKKKKGPKTVSADDAKKALERSMEPPDRKAKYQTNKPVSAKQVQQFDKDITGQAADQRSGAGGKPGAGRTGTLRGQTITKGPYKGATPIARSEREILRLYAKGEGVGENPLRSEPGSGAELTAGRRRSLKASARRAQEKQDQAVRTRDYKKQVTAAGKEVLKDVQSQGKREARLRAVHQRGTERGTAARMSAAATRRINKQGSDLLKQIQRQSGAPRGQLSLPGLGRAFGRGAGARASAAQDAAIDIAKDQRRAAGFRDLAKAVNTKGKPVTGAAANPWNQFPKKPQPQLGIPKPESSRLPTKLLTPSKQPAGALPEPKPRPASTLVPSTKPSSVIDTKIKPVTVKDITPSPKPPVAPPQVIQVPVKPRAPKPNPVITALKQFRGRLSRGLGKAAGLYSLTQTIPNILQNLDTFSPDYVPPKPVEPKVKPVQPEPAKPTQPEPEPVPQILPLEPTKPKSPVVKTPPVAPPGKDNNKTPGGTRSPDKVDEPVTVPDIFRMPVPVTPRTGPTTRSPKPTRKPSRFRLPGLGFPDQPGGKIGRRSNPQ